MSNCGRNALQLSPGDERGRATTGVEQVAQRMRPFVIRSRSLSMRTKSMSMVNGNTTPIERLLALVLGLLRMPPGRRRIRIAFLYGLLCHVVFALAVGAMIVAMFFGMSESLGRLQKPWSFLANAFLIAQFPLIHSLLLSARGSKLLKWFAPAKYATTLSTTTFAIIASIQLIVLFALWTPSGVVWWRAEGLVFYVFCTLYASSWLLLIKASYDAGAEVQSGALGWMSMAQDKRPVFPGMPTAGLFRHIRQPIYVSFALTLWTVPVWTPDQLALAVLLTAYCLLAPKLKEARFEMRYGDSFQNYKNNVPYVMPYLRRHKHKKRHALE